MTRSEWKADMRTALADMNGVVRDMLRRPADRELGPIYHREIYEAAYARLVALLDIEPEDDPAPENEHGDPAGLGSAGPNP
jgi:hypothetical protein